MSKLTQLEVKLILEFCNERIQAIKNLSLSPLEKEALSKAYDQIKGKIVQFADAIPPSEQYNTHKRLSEEELRKRKTPIIDENEKNRITQINNGINGKLEPETTIANELKTFFKGNPTKTVKMIDFAQKMNLNYQSVRSTFSQFLMSNLIVCVDRGLYKATNKLLEDH